MSVGMISQTISLIILTILVAVVLAKNYCDFLDLCERTEDIHKHLGLDKQPEAK